MDYNLSPQGDGNIIGVVNLASGESLQLIPARGRKLPAGYVHDRVHDITAYPRKGTVTSSRGSSSWYPHITTYPRKGTKTRNADPYQLHSRITTYPRKGTKKPLRAGTNQCGGALFFRFFCFGVSGRAFRRGWPHQRELPRCPAGRSASGGGSHAGRRRSLAGYL